MTEQEDTIPTDAVEQLQQLGFKEYEAEALVAVVALGVGTAKEVSEVSSIPRTRVYDAMRVLEAKGLVEVQHTSPQKFRAIPVSETINTLEREYEFRFDELGQELSQLETSDRPESSSVHEVWSLENSAAITSRTESLIEAADNEVVVVFGVEEAITDTVLESLQAASDRGVTVIVGGLSTSLVQRLEGGLSDAKVFSSGLEWLEPTTVEAEPAIGRLMLVDRSNIFVSSIDRSTGDERAVFGSGFTNGLVVVVRRLLMTGVFPEFDVQID